MEEIRPDDPDDHRADEQDEESNIDLLHDRLHLRKRAANGRIQASCTPTVIVSQTCSRMRKTG
jgi:hypothetical protein